MVEINNKIPSFCLLNQDKEEVCETNFKDNWLVLYFYPKDNTPGCTLEARNFTYFENEFKKHNTKVVGISPDSCDSHHKFTEKHDLTVTLLSDPDHKVLEKFNVWKPKKLYGKEFLGVVRTTFLIDPNGTIRNIWNKVKVPGHIENVLEKIKEIQKDEGEINDK
jgi:peroxiredoxin Q/BCP